MAMKQATTTQIRNFYSPENSYLNVSFYNTNLSLRFAPFMTKDPNGRDRYDMKGAETTTINYANVFALYELTKNIVDHKIEGCNLDIATNGGKLVFSYTNGTPPSLTLDKNGKKIEFKFETTTAGVMENGKMEQKTLNTGLGVFMKTLDGFLSGINSDRHLDKLTDNYVASLQNGDQNKRQNGGNYQNNGNNFNRGNGGYQKNNYNRNNYNPPAPQQPAQNLDDYEVPF